VLDVAVNQMTLINNQLIRKALPSHPPTRSAHRAGHQHSAG
jgi:hypothetical protein